ncbi:uncharacterized protein LOC130046496 [Ostrea edulis]|uniref:uncharacterized protein LOC130046496 n=1 Tax=Ostrea edulis TaxID=37623 RepID=UPI0024AF693F|nr:uncharacterized protein LOC130046496 [Ostrea edulis]
MYYGDDDVHDRIQASSSSDIAWTGIAKQIFISSSVGSIHSNSILLQCFNCNRDGCSFGNCSERRHAICNKHRPETYTSSTSSSTTSLTSVSSSEQPPEQPSIAPPRSSTATQSSTSLSSHLSATNTTMISITESSTSTAGKTSTVTPSSLENYQDHGINTQTIVAVVISLVAISIFVGVTFFCIRKKICHHKDQDGPRSRDERELVTYDEIQLTEPKLNTNGIVVNDNYFVLEPEQKSIKQEILQDNECYDHLGDVDKEKGYTNSHLYTNTIEFTAEQNNSGDDEDQLYNHLWEKSSGPVEDSDIYSHMPPEDDYEYSTAEREDLKRTSNYDHVVLNENNSFEIVRNGNDPCEI